MFVFVVTCTHTLRKYFFSSYFEWSLSWWHVQVRALWQYSPSSRFDIRCVGGLSFVVVWNIFECFSEGGGLSFYWCISFARYAIYWYKRLEAKESFGMENISENGFGEEMKGNWWHGGFLFHRIKRGQSLFLTIHLCRDFFGGGALFSARNIVWERCREKTFDHLGIKFTFSLDEKRWWKCFSLNPRKGKGQNGGKWNYFTWTKERERGIPESWKQILFENCLRGGGWDNVLVHLPLLWISWNMAHSEM